MRRVRVGVFDSGLGGLSFLKAYFENFLETQRPDYIFDYIADDAYAPYGNLSSAKIIERSLFLTERLLKRNADIIVLACNTATAEAIDTLRERYPEVLFVGIEPYLSILNKRPLISKHDTYAVITTQATGRSKRFLKLKERFDPSNKISHFICKKLAGLIEKALILGLDPKVESEIYQELAFLDQQHFDYVILGCTHYSFIDDLIYDRFGVNTICPAFHVGRRVRELVGDNFLESNKEEKTLIHFESIKMEKKVSFYANDLFSNQQSSFLKNREYQKFFKNIYESFGGF